MALGLFALLLAQVAATSPNPIVVQGVRDRDRQIHNFVRDLTPADFDNQLTRFEAPVCPKVLGLAAEQQDHIAARIRRVASAAGAQVAKPPCDPNIILIVTADKAALLKMFEKKRDDYIPMQWSSAYLHQIERDPNPVAAWQLKDIVWTDGVRPMPTTAASNVSTEDFVQQAHPLIAPLSRLRPEARHEFVASIVVVQLSGLAGISTTQLADYVAMRALAGVKPQYLRPSSPDSILKVIDAPIGSPTPLTLTQWDLSFLKALYASSKDVYAGTQRSEISWRMKRELDKAAAVQQ